MKTGPDRRKWVIGNGLVEREIFFDAQIGLYTPSWKHGLTGTNFIKSVPAANPRGAEFYFKADGDRLAGSEGSFDCVASEEHDLAVPRGRVLSIKLKARTKPIEVSVFYAVYDGHPVVRKWIAITNHSTAAIRLSRLCFEAVPLLAGNPSDIQVSAFYGVLPHEICFSGRVDDTAIVQRNSLTREGYVVMNEAPGYTKHTEMDGWGLGIQVMYDMDIFPFERRVEPGETFTSARSGVAFFKEGQGFSDPRWVMPTYTSQVLLKKGAGYKAPWNYNAYSPFHEHITKDIVNGLIPVAARMGFDIFTVDGRWEELSGANEVSRERFGGEIDSVQKEVERRGMRFGLWAPMCLVDQQTKEFKEHPEWACRDAHGKIKTSNTEKGWLPVMCMASPYREAAARRICDLIKRYNLAYVKIDQTSMFNTYGEAPGCYAEDHHHHGWAESLHGIYEGIKYVTDQVYREHPDVLLDLTFELWGQKHLIDYGLLAAGDLDWLSNIADFDATTAGPRQARTLLYQRSLAIPVETMLIGNFRANIEPIELRFATTIGSAPLLLGDLRLLTPEAADWYGERIRWYREFRKQVSINESFFPLGSWLQPSAAEFDGFVRISRRGEGILVLFRNESKQDKFKVAAPVYPDGTFKVRSVITGDKRGSFSGAEMRKGIEIQVPAGHHVEVLEIRRAGEPPGRLLIGMGGTSTWSLEKFA